MLIIAYKKCYVFFRPDWSTIVGEMLIFTILLILEYMVSCYFNSFLFYSVYDFFSPPGVKSNDLWNLQVQCHIHKGSPIILMLSQINQISYIITHFFKIRSAIILPLRGLLLVALCLAILKNLYYLTSS